MQATFFDFTEVSDQLRQRATLRAQHALQLLEQLPIREVFQPPKVLTTRHDTESTPRIFKPLRAPPAPAFADERRTSLGPHPTPH